MNQALRPRQSEHERGVSTVWTVVTLPAFFMIVWAGVEVANATLAAGRARSASDLVALAAAARYADGPEAAVEDATLAATVARVQLVIASAGTPGGDLEFGSWDPVLRVFTPDLDGGRAVRATIRFEDGHPNGPVSGILPAAFGPGSFDVTRSSVAVYCPPRDRTSLLLLGSGTTLAMRDATLMVADGVIAVTNGSSGLDFAPTSSLRAPVLALPDLLGTTVLGEGFDVDVDEQSFVPPDPFTATVLPGAGVPLPIDPAGGGVSSVAPGTHSGLVAAAGEIVLQPGDHVFTESIVLSGTALLRLQDARIVLEPGCSLVVEGFAQVLGEGRSVGDDGMGGWIVLRDGSLGADLVARDQAVVEVVGIVYAPLSQLAVSEDARWSSTGAILHSIDAGGSAQVIWTGGVAALEQPQVPGRARLVR